MSMESGGNGGGIHSIFVIDAQREVFWACYCISSLLFSFEFAILGSISSTWWCDMWNSGLSPSLAFFTLAHSTLLHLTSLRFTLLSLCGFRKIRGSQLDSS